MFKSFINLLEKNFKFKSSIILFIEFIGFIIILKILGFNNNFFLHGDGYYNCMLHNNSIFHRGPGWANYIMFWWTGIIPLNLHWIFKLFYNFIFYLSAYLIFYNFVKKIFFREKNYLYIFLAFISPLGFYFVFKPSPEIYLLPMFIYLFFSLYYQIKFINKDYINVIIIFIIIIFYYQFKPVLIFFSLGGILLSVFKKRINYLLIIALILSNIIGFVTYMNLSKKQNIVETKSLLRIPMVSSMKVEMMYSDIFSNKDTDFFKADFHSSFEQKSIKKAKEIIDESDNESAFIVKWFMKNPKYIFILLFGQTLLLLGNFGRPIFLLILSPINFLILLYLLIYTKRKYKIMAYMIIFYTLTFIFTLGIFRYFWPMSFIFYFLFLKTITKQIDNKKLSGVFNDYENT